MCQFLFDPVIENPGNNVKMDEIKNEFGIKFNKEMVMKINM